MSRFKTLDWYREHPEVLVRHHGQRWTVLHNEVLRLLFFDYQPLAEMTRMLGRTETAVMNQLSRLKLIWWDTRWMTYRVWSKNVVLYDGRTFTPITKSAIDKAREVWKWKQAKLLKRAA